MGSKVQVEAITFRSSRDTSCDSKGLCIFIAVSQMESRIQGEPMRSRQISWGIRLSQLSVDIICLFEDCVVL